MSRRRRAVSPVLSTVLMVAVVVVLGATISVFAFTFLDSVDDPAPNIAQTSGAFVPQDGDDGGIVQITHEAGDSVRVSDIEIAVRAACAGGTKQGRIVNLPAGSGNDIDESDGQIEGDNIFDERSLTTISNKVSGVDDGGALLHNEAYDAGETILFRIPSGDCTLESGSEVSVRVVHTPSEAVIIEQELTA